MIEVIRRAATVSVMALALAAVVPFDGDGSVFAQGKSQERGGGNGNGNGNGGGNGAATRAASNDGGAPTRSQLGRLNAANASQAALDAHVRNGNFTGTIGALAQYQLVSRHAAGEDLTEAEQQRIEDLLAAAGGGALENELDIDISASLDAANQVSAEQGFDALYTLDGATVVCAGSDCQETAIAALQSEVDAQLPDGSPSTGALLAASEARILDSARDPAPGDAILDVVARALGFDRTAEPEDPLEDVLEN